MTFLELKKQIKKEFDRVAPKIRFRLECATWSSCKTESVEFRLSIYPDNSEFNEAMTMLDKCYTQMTIFDDTQTYDTSRPKGILGIVKRCVKQTLANFPEQKAPSVSDIEL